MITFIKHGFMLTFGGLVMPSVQAACVNLFTPYTWLPATQRSTASRAEGRYGEAVEPEADLGT